MNIVNPYSTPPAYASTDQRQTCELMEGAWIKGSRAVLGEVMEYLDMVTKIQNVDGPEYCALLNFKHSLADHLALDKEDRERYNVL